MKEFVDIRDYTTFKVGGQFRYFIEINNARSLSEVISFAKEKSMPIKVIGGGSNMVFPDGVLECVALKMNIQGFENIDETDDHIDIQIGAGENWDQFVSRTVDMNLSGIEALSAIPGTAGATPIQNVGAYGQEVKNTILAVEVFEGNENTIKVLSNTDCKFSYRDSIFKNEAKGKYIITSVTFRLSKQDAKIPDYIGVKKYFEEKGIANPNLKQIREAIIEIRSTKLPDPSIIPNVGSFFKNPIVKKEIADDLKSKNASAVIFQVDEKLSKIGAGWLIEQSGLKGHDFGAISVYKNNALVLVNNGVAKKKDVTETKEAIIKTVQEKFGIMLETEPEFV